MSSLSFSLIMFISPIFFAAGSDFVADDTCVFVPLYTRVVHLVQLLLLLAYRVVACGKGNGNYAT